MASLLKTTLIASLALVSVATAQATAQTTPVAGPVNPQLVGTWSTKSNKVFTGPGFYDPVNEKMFEPDLTGISYSFTADGFFEEAYYRAVSNPTQPQCPQGIMQFQHGTFIQDTSNSLHLTPFAVDGRQLLSSPCQYSNSVYTRYNQTELFKRFEVFTDPYHNILRLNLFQFDGSPMNPMYLAYKPPQMLPTQTLNPITAKTSKGSQATSKSKVKRSFEDATVLMKRNEPMDGDKWWWIGVGMTGIGAVGYFCF